MAKISGRFRVLLIFTILIKITLADQDPLNDPSLEIIRNEDADENYTGNIADPNGIPCRDPTPINGVLEVISGIPFKINNVTVKLTCRHGLVFSDGTEKIEHCYAAPTPIKVTGIWSPDQGRLVCQDPTTGSEKQSVASGTKTQTQFKPTTFVPHWAGNTGPNPVPCQDPTPTNGALEVMAGVPFVILNITVKVTCHQGLQFPDGSTEVTAKCLPAPTPYHVTGVWVPDIPYKCIEPKTEAVNTKSVEGWHQKRFLESLVCPDPSAQSNTVTDLDGDPNHLYSKVEVKCNAGLHFSNGQDTVNVTCLPLPHPCMCMAAWETETDFQLMYNFNCTARTDVQNGIHPQAPPIAEEPRRQEVGETRISKEELPDSEKETRLAKSTDEVQEYENDIPVVINSEQEIRTNNIEQPNNIENSINENEFGIYEHNNQIYHKKEISNSVLDEINDSSNKENIPNQNVEEETENQAENVELENNHYLTNSETEESEVINSEDVEIIPEMENNDQLNENTEDVESNLNEHEEDNEENEHTDSVEENEITEESEVHQIQAPPLAEINTELPEEIAEEDERDEAELSESNEENNYTEVNEESHGYEEEEEEGEENEGNNEDMSNEEEQDEHENEEEIEPMENTENNEHEVEKIVEHESENEENVDNEIEEEQEIHQENEGEEEEDEEERVEQEQVNNEPEEEHWEDIEKTYSEPSTDDSESNIVILDEALPLGGTSIVEEEEEIAPEENIVTEKIGTEEIEEHNEEEEPHMNEIPKEMDEPEVGVEVEFDDDGVERPGPLHEVQQTPFHRADEDSEIEIIEHEEDPCLLPADSGYGKHVHTRHFFNVDTQECERFIYGGSGGNENNFATLDECVKSCYTQRS